MTMNIAPTSITLLIRILSKSIACCRARRRLRRPILHAAVGRLLLFALIALVSIAQIQAQDYSPNTLSIDSLVPDNQADESAKSIDSIDNIDNIDSIDNIDTVSTEETAVSSGFSGPEELASIPIMPETIISAGILVDGLEFDIPMPWGQQEFEKFRASFLTPGGRKWLTAVMQNSLAYLDYVEERIETYGLPKELAFLPVIESEYSPYAVSRSGATGIWQFMKNSIAGYGLSISDWTDDRKDFMKSTDAALRKLRDNNSVLNDWLLALAAYNAGVGAVTRAIRSTNSETVDFWYLYDRKILSKEPMSYIPKFLAVASILRYPELHGFPGEWGDRHAWETIETTRQVDMNILAQKAKIPLEVLKKGNAELKYHITPPSSSHVVKVPAPMADTARAILSDTSSPLFKYDIYTVKSGDTMSEIAQRFGTPLAIILQANPGVRADRIRIGQALVIPHLPGRSVAKSQNSPGESLNFSSSYTVKSGDTLWDIAIRFGISPEVLADKNGISMNSTLRIGQRLKVPPL